MGQILHGSATTTEAIRRAIQRSQESLRALASATGSTTRRSPNGSRGPRSPIGSLGRRSRSRRSSRSRTRRSSSLSGDTHYCRSTIAFTRCAASDALLIASLPAASRHLAASRRRRRQAGQAQVQGLCDRLLPCRPRRGANCGRQAPPLRCHRPNVEIRLRSTHKAANMVTSCRFLEALVAAVPYKIHTVLTGNGIQFADLQRTGQVQWPGSAAIPSTVPVAGSTSKIG